MNLKHVTLAVITAFVALPAVAQDTAAPAADATAAAPAAAPTGDAEAGAKVFAKCQTCHVVTDPSGQVLAGKNAKIGPNLYGIVGRTAGSYPEFKYGDSMKALGESGFAWSEDEFVAYVADPSKYLKAKLNDPKAKGLMSFKLANATDAHNVWAFLASLGPKT